MNAEGRIPLARALRDAARELDALQPPPAALAGARAALAKAHPQARRRRLGWPLAWSGAAACAVVLAASALLMLRPPPAADADRWTRASGFVPVAPPERWEAADGPAWLVATELPSERLAALGLPYDPAHAGARVRAELLVHPSGEVLAVRFLR